jgi:hypothetical protein
MKQERGHERQDDIDPPPPAIKEKGQSPFKNQAFPTERKAYRIPA